MKYIRKRKPPIELNRWKKVNAKIADAQYGSHGFPTDIVHRALLKEQGHICAYTMIRVDESTSHIEHLKPQTVSRSEGNLAETSDYLNIVTCYPRSRRPEDPAITFGAIYRESNWDPVKFISPLKPSCQAAFQYQTDGSVVAKTIAIGDPEWMIRTLNLNASELQDMRRAAIEGYGLSLTAQKPAKAREVRNILAAVCQTDKHGRFQPYCLAIMHAAQHYLLLIEKQSKRKQYIRKTKPRGRK